MYCLVGAIMNLMVDDLAPTVFDFLGAEYRVLAGVSRGMEKLTRCGPAINSVETHVLHSYFKMRAEKKLMELKSAPLVVRGQVQPALARQPGFWSVIGRATRLHINQSLSPRGPLFQHLYNLRLERLTISVNSWSGFANDPDLLAAIPMLRARGVFKELHLSMFFRDGYCLLVQTLRAYDILPDKMIFMDNKGLGALEIAQLKGLSGARQWEYVASYAG